MRKLAAVDKSLWGHVSSRLGSACLLLVIAAFAALTPAAIAAKSHPGFNSHASSPAMKDTVVKVDTLVVYKVLPLDNLWSIAKKELGDPFKWDVIYKANPAIKKPNYIFPGQRLRIPKTITEKKPSTAEELAKRVDPKASKKPKLAYAKVKRPQLEIPDIVIDRTRSPIGEDFVDLFNQSFNPPNKGESYNIAIEEKPLPGLGALVFVKVNGTPVFKSFLQPRFGSIRTVAQKAAGIVSAYVADYQQIQKNLDGEDMSGTGIY